MSNDESGTKSRSDTIDTGATSGIAGSGSQARGTSSGAAADVVQDVGQGEAYVTQIKRLVAGELDLDSLGRFSAFYHMNRQFTNAGSRDEELHQVSLQAIQNAVNYQNDAARQYLERVGTARDLAIDRWWNIDEVSLGALSATIATVVSTVLSRLGQQE